jgi:hypothetical protein
VRAASKAAAAVFALFGCTVVERGPSVFSDGAIAGQLRGGDMREVSGMVASLTHPGHFWLHNDSGAEAEIILVDSTGLERARVRVHGARNRDWEDISRRGDTLFMADIGDNGADYDTVFVYSVLEPRLLTDTVAPLLAAYPFQYPNGPRDAEALLVDHRTGDWIIVSKREENSHVYRYAAPQTANALMTIERTDVALPFRLAVSGDVSVDGTEILIKSYDEVFYWQRADSETVVTALRRAPRSQPYVPERQGEAIAFTLDGLAYMTSSEIELDDPQLLIRYARRLVAAKDSGQ